ncbi:MAG: transposase [Cyanobacteria bacterium P01_G01_bin.39]
MKNYLICILKIKVSNLVACKNLNPPPSSFKSFVIKIKRCLLSYNKRAGIEGTISQGVRRSALRQSRYVGLAKTHLQHILISIGLNLCRLNDWLDDIPLAATRYSRFMALKPKANSI